MINFASRAEYRERIERVVVYINQHLNDSLDINTLAGVSNFSVTHFARIFQGAMNETPENYITRLRVERAAKSLMSSPGKSVVDIATACGFSSHLSLDQAFTNHYGVSIGEYARGRHLQSLADSCGIQANTMANGEKSNWNVSLRDIDGQTWAVFLVECRAEEVESQYLAIYRDWLPDSGFEPADKPGFEEIENSKNENGKGLYRRDIHIPVKPLFKNPN
jgi:AraC-like DNA-binding protein